MSSPNPGKAVFDTVVTIGSLGFVPVAVRFRIFPILSDFGGPANGRDVRDAYLKSARGGTTDTPPVKLIEDTLVAMTALSWVDAVGENLYRANKLTQYLGSTPSAIHGILHFTTEVLLSSAFLMRKLEATGFEYPFTGLQTPTQHAYALMGRDDLAGLHTYAIMAAEGRIASFNTFMQGRFGMDAKTPERLQALGYDISSVVQEARGEGSPVKMVDVGGGRGDLLRDIKDAIPGLVERDLIVAESNSDITDLPGLTLVNWDYLTEDVPDMIKGALVYHLSGVLHNLPDLGAARLLQKIAGAMERYSRVLIHERCRDEIPAANATMVVLYGGRERSREDWRQLAELAGLKVTFMVFPDGPGQGVVELRRK